MTTVDTGRFSQPTRDAMWRHEDELVHFAHRVTHLLSFELELEHVRNGKPFLVYHQAMWQMLLSERDMLVVDLASWALGFYETGSGGFLRQLRGPDLQALKLNWKYEGPSAISVDGQPHPEIDAHVRGVNREWRKKAFDRLFPSGTKGSTPNVPCQQDIDDLCGRLEIQFKALHDDRNQHRAHRHEKGPKTAAMLSLEEVTTHLEACQSLLADLRCLSSNSHFVAHGYNAKGREDDRHAQDVVDLILFGSLRTIVNAEYGPNRTPGDDLRFYWQRRKAQYARLHALHEAAGKPEEPFNNRALVPMTHRGGE